MKLSARMKMKAKGIYVSIVEPLAETVNGYAKEVESIERENEKLKDEVKELRAAVESVIKLQKENYGDGMITHIKLIGRAKALKELLAKHDKG